MSAKISSGIKGLDLILNGGYLKGCPTIIKGIPGSGKTIFSLFFAHKNYTAGTKVVYLSCDESAEAILKNLESYHLDGKKAVEDKKLDILDMRPNPEDEVNGQYELTAVLFRIQQKLDKNNPVVIIDSLQNLLIDQDTKVAEQDLFKLIFWTRKNNVTLLVTNVFQSSFTKLKMLEDYAVDCVICLEQEIDKHLMTRYLRVQKMRGSAHGTNQYPFCLTQKGVSLYPVTNSKLDRHQSIERISTGITKLDAMLDGGLREKTTITISGTTGTAKTLLAATIAQTALQAGQKVLYVSFEESINNFVFNIKSVGINLDQFIESKQCIIHSTRSCEMGLEEHLIRLVDFVDDYKPNLLIIDPISSLIEMGTLQEVKDTLVRFLAIIIEKNTTLIFTELLKTADQHIGVLSISSIIDTMIMLERVDNNGESNRMIQIVKSRGSASSNQIKEFKITRDGIKIENPYLGKGGVIFGSAKMEKIEADREHKFSLETELQTIELGMDTLNTYKRPENNWQAVKLAMLNLSLTQKREHITNKLNSIAIMQKLNQNLREDIDE